MSSTGGGKTCSGCPALDRVTSATVKLRAVTMSAAGDTYLSTAWITMSRVTFGEDPIRPVFVPYLDRSSQGVKEPVRSRLRVDVPRMQPDDAFVAALAERAKASTPTTEALRPRRTLAAVAAALSAAGVVTAGAVGVALVPMAHEGPSSPTVKPSVSVSSTTTTNQRRGTVDETDGTASATNSADDDNVSIPTTRSTAASAEVGDDADETDDADTDADNAHRGGSSHATKSHGTPTSTSTSRHRHTSDDDEDEDEDQDSTDSNRDHAGDEAKSTSEAKAPRSSAERNEQRQPAPTESAGRQLQDGSIGGQPQEGQSGEQN